MEKNEIYVGTVCGTGADGEGVIKLQGTTAFVPYCLKGEKVAFKVLKTSGNTAYGKAERIIEASAERRTPVCPVFERCGGCQLQHMSYNSQLDFKRESVATALKKIGGLDVAVEKTVAADREYRYRNKLVLPVGNDGTDNVFGFYAGRSHRIVPADDCFIQAEWMRGAVAAVREFMAENGLKGYDETARTGDIRRLVVREIGGAFVVTVVAARFINLGALCRKLNKLFEKYTLTLNVNRSPGNAVFSDEWHINRGEDFFTAVVCGIKYRAGANTFLQVNDGVRDKLYDAVVKAVADKNAVALDLYSGGGLLTAMLAGECRAAYGIEIVKEASICADELKNLNGLQGKMFNICGKVEDKIAAVAAATAGTALVIVCDPPRKGMERSVVRAVRDASPEKIVLVSCNPATLARDMGLLLGSLKEENGAIVRNREFDPSAADYKIEKVVPFDMFPQTRHVETLVLLERKNHI